MPALPGRVVVREVSCPQPLIRNGGGDDCSVTAVVQLLQYSPPEVSVGGGERQDVGQVPEQLLNRFPPGDQLGKLRRVEVRATVAADDQVKTVTYDGPPPLLPPRSTQP